MLQYRAQKPAKHPVSAGLYPQIAAGFGAVPYPLPGQTCKYNQNILKGSQDPYNYPKGQPCKEGGSIFAVARKTSAGGELLSRASLVMFHSRQHVVQVPVTALQYAQYLLRLNDQAAVNAFLQQHAADFHRQYLEVLNNALSHAKHTCAPDLAGTAQPLPLDLTAIAQCFVNNGFGRGAAVIPVNAAAEVAAKVLEPWDVSLEYGQVARSGRIVSETVIHLSVQYGQTLGRVKLHVVGLAPELA